MIKLYRRVAQKDVLPPPFNLVQLVILLPFLLVDHLCNRRTRYVIRSCVGACVFWLVSGPFIIALGWVLWVVSIPPTMIKVWKGSQLSPLARVLACLPVAPFYLYCTPFILGGFWVQSAIAGVPFLLKSNLCSQHCCVKPGASEPATSDGGRSQPAPPEVSVVKMLKKAKDGFGVWQIWRYLEDPNTPASPEMRREEQNSQSTVEHVRLLTSRIEATHSGIAELFKRVESGDAAMKGKVADLDRSVGSRFADLESSMERIVEARLGKLEDKIKLLLVPR